MIVEKNWSGSSKAMEADMGADLVKKQIERGKPIKAMVMDNDSTTHSTIQKEISFDILKYRDMNHTTKNLTGLLYQAAHDHKILKSNKEV